MATFTPVIIGPDSLLQHVSRTAYAGMSLHYGAEAANRYDAPGKNYGVLYLGPDLPTALMESVFHKHNWFQDHTRHITLAEIKSRLVRVVGVMQPIALFDMTAPGVMARHFGLNLQQLAGRDYDITRKLSGQVHAMTLPGSAGHYDGILYPSRNNYPSTSIALFDRAKHKIAVLDDIVLDEHRDWPRFVRDYELAIVTPDP